MGHSPKSRVRDLLGGVPVRAAAHKGRSRRAGMVMLWLAAAVAITGVYQLESMYDLAGLRAWRTRGAKDAAAARAGSAAPSARAAFEPAAGVGAGADADPGPDAADSLAPAAAAPAYDGTFVYQAAGAGAAARGAPAESEETGAAINAAPRAAAQPAPAAAAEPARKQAIPPRALLLASHSRLVWYDPETDESTILHEGGVSGLCLTCGRGMPAGSDAACERALFCGRAQERCGCQGNSGRRGRPAQTHTARQSGRGGAFAGRLPTPASHNPTTVSLPQTHPTAGRALRHVPR